MAKKNTIDKIIETILPKKEEKSKLKKEDCPTTKINNGSPSN